MVLMACFFGLFLMLVGYMGFLVLPVEKERIVEAFKKTEMTYYQDDTKDLGDGFFSRNRENYVLVKFPDKYLENIDVYKEGIKIAVVKVYGDSYKESSIERVQDSEGVYFIVNKGDKAFYVYALFLSQDDDTLVGISIKK